MLLLRTDSLPSGDQWLYELKLDGYRSIRDEHPLARLLLRETEDALNQPNGADAAGRQRRVGPLLQAFLG